MQQPGGVHGLERSDGLAHQANRFLGRDGATARHEVGEVVPLEVLHAQVGRAVLLEGRVDGCDLRVAERGCGPRLAQEALPPGFGVVI